VHGQLAPRGGVTGVGLVVAIRYRGADVAAALCARSR
jgi:hypothetical protein